MMPPAWTKRWARSMKPPPAPQPQLALDPPSKAAVTAATAAQVIPEMPVAWIGNAAGTRHRDGGGE